MPININFQPFGEIPMLGKMPAPKSPRGFNIKLRAVTPDGREIREDRFFPANNKREHYGLPYSWNQRFRGSLDALAWRIRERIRFGDCLGLRPVERSRDHALIAYLQARLRTPGKRDRPLIENAQVWAGHAGHAGRVLLTIESPGWTEDRFTRLQDGLAAVDEGWRAFAMPEGFGFANPFCVRLIVIRPPARVRLYPEFTRIAGAFFDEQDVRYLCESMSDAFYI